MNMYNGITNCTTLPHKFTRRLFVLAHEAYVGENDEFEWNIQKAPFHMRGFYSHIDGSVQYCSNYGALAMESLQSYAKPSIWKVDCAHNLLLMLWGRK